MLAISIFAGLSQLVACSPSSLGDTAPAPGGTSTQDVLAWSPTIRTLATPTGEGSTSPQLTTLDGSTVLSWIEQAPQVDTVKFSAWIEGAWSEPRTVVAADNLFVNSADVPAVARLSGGTLVAQWLRETNPEAEAYDLSLAWSRDDGRSWSAPVSPHHDGTVAQHGFASFFTAPEGALGVLWLDGRALAQAAHHSTEGHGAAGHATSSGNDTGMDLMSATFDATGRQLSETRVDARVCDCCPTSVAATSRGPLVAFRDRSPSEVRDIKTARLDGQAWLPAREVHADEWRIEACPVNGPAVIAEGVHTAVAWFTAAKGRGRAQIAFSADGGDSFAAPYAVSEGFARGRVDAVMLADGSAVVSWVEVVGGASQLRLRRVSATGVMSPVATVAGTQGELLGYPKLERVGGTLLLAWSENQGRSRVVSAAIDLSGR